jgi:ferredoxin
MLFEGDDVIFLPKDSAVQIKLDRKIENQGDLVLPSKVVEHFIKKSKYHWIMNFCICRESSKCEDYPADLGCLFLGEAVLDINPGYGRLVSKEDALDHVKRCSDAGLVHLIGRNKLDSVWLDATPSDKLMTICNCCPCCCLYKFLPYAKSEIGNKFTKMPGVAVKVTDMCVGCSACAKDTVCFIRAITLQDGKSVSSEECRGCGRCVEVCPQGARELVLDYKEAVRKTVDQITPLVDIT